MNTKTDTPAELQQSAFIEYHYYKGGLRTEFVALEQDRPAWAPPPDWVGFRSEFVLQGSDLVIEVVKFGAPSSVVTWIGIYQHSPDQVYGDRQNHAGIGVWLFNKFPTAPYELVEGLRKLLELFLSDSSNKFSATVRHFLSEYIGGYVAELTQLPPPLNGMRLANSQLLTTFQYQVQRDAENWQKRLNDLFFRLYFLYPEGREENRALIYIPSTPTVAGAVTSAFEVFKKERFISEFLPKVPVAFTSQAKAIVELEKKSLVSEASVGQLLNKVSQLETVVANERDVRTSVERQYNDLKQSLEENDELKRFAILNQGISQLKSQVAAVEREMQSIRKNVSGDIERAMRPSTMPGNVRPQFNVNTTQNTERLAKSRELNRKSNSWNISWITVVTIAVITLILIGLLIYMRPF